MALVNIIRASFLSIESWSSETLDANMLQADLAYGEVLEILQTENEEKPNELLLMSDLDCMNAICLFNHIFKVEYNSQETSYGNFGTQEIGDSKSLKSALQGMLKEHSGGIITLNNKCFGIIHQNFKFYVSDPYPCSTLGKPNDFYNPGVGCIISCPSLEDASKVLHHRAEAFFESVGLDQIFDPSNVIFNLDYIGVSKEELAIPSMESVGVPNLSPSPLCIDRNMQENSKLF